MTPENDQKLLVLKLLRSAKRIYLAGNGGSAANAIHIANDLVSCGLKAQALTADVATLTAIGNDFGYDFVFSRQLGVFGEPGDLLIVLSGSGNSPNVIHALFEAAKLGMTSLAITGAWNESNAAEFATFTIKHGENMQTAEDHQVKLIHDVYRVLKGFDPE